MRKLTAFFYVLIAFVAISACKKTVEGENKAWQANLKELTDLKIDYPKFSSAIDGQVAKAEAVKKEADAISDQEKKIQKMADANQMLSPEFVTNLKSFKAKKKSLNDNIIKLETSPKDDNMKQSAASVASEARMLLRGIDDKLNANIATYEDATSVARKVSEDLKQAETNVENLLSKLVKKVTTDTTKTTTGNNTNTNTAAPVAAQVKCKYCGVMADASLAKCKSCGAPLKK